MLLAALKIRNGKWLVLWSNEDLYRPGASSFPVGNDK
jgi:hypothetical protein